MSTATPSMPPAGLPPMPKGGKPQLKPQVLAEASGPNYMPLNLSYPGLKKVNQKPPIYTVDNFLTLEECDAFIETAKPLLQRSKTHAIAGAPPPQHAKPLLRQLSHAPLCAQPCACALRADSSPMLCAG